MLFVISAIDKSGSHALRTATRQDHFDYVERTGQVRLGGPYLDDGGNMIGSLIILEADSLADAEAWAVADPYAKAGLFETTSVTPWKATVNACGAEL